MGCPNIFCHSLFAAQKSFTKAVCFFLMQKFLSTVYLLCVCEDRNLNIVSKMIGTVCQAFPNSQNKTHFNKGENSNTGTDLL